MQADKKTLERDFRKKQKAERGFLKHSNLKKGTIMFRKKQKAERGFLKHSNLKKGTIMTVPESCSRRN
jgi:hypothetical protein